MNILRPAVLSILLGLAAIPVTAGPGLAEAAGSPSAGQIAAFLTVAGKMDHAARQLALVPFEDQELFDLRKDELKSALMGYYNGLTMLSFSRDAEITAAAKAAMGTISDLISVIDDTPNGPAMGPYWAAMGDAVLARQGVMATIMAD